jgi:hypothetical protein
MVPLLPAPRTASYVYLVPKPVLISIWLQFCLEFYVISPKEFANNTSKENKKEKKRKTQDFAWEKTIEIIQQDGPMQLILVLYFLP